MKKSKGMSGQTIVLAVIIILSLLAIGLSIAVFTGALGKKEGYTGDQDYERFPTDRPWCYDKSFSQGSAKSLPIPKCNPKSPSAVGCPDPKPRMLEIPLAKKCNQGPYMYQGSSPGAKECRQFLSNPGNFIEAEKGTCCKGMVGKPIRFQYNSPSEQFFVDKKPTTGGRQLGMSC